MSLQPNMSLKPYMNIQPNLSYKHKILIGFIFLISIFEAIVIIYDIQNAYQLRQEFLLQRSQLIIQTYTQALRVPSWNLDQDTSESILKSILVDSDITKVKLSYQQNILPAIQFTSKKNHPPDKNDFIVQDSVFEPDLGADNGHSDKIIASLTLFFSKHSLNEFLSARKTEGLIQFAILLLCNFIIAYLLINWITSPLLQLSKSIRRLANHELDISIPISNRNDEIDKVAHSVSILQKNNIELDQLRSSMEAIIKEQTEDLVIAKEKAEAASLAKGQFLATMSHEIRTPMNGVLGMANILNETSLNKEQQDSVDIILKSGQDLIAIINEILDFSKLDADQIVLEKLPFNLKNMIQDLFKILTPSIVSNDLKLILDYTSESPEFFIGDSVRVKQILLNLLNNAIKFTPSGSVKVIVEYTAKNGIEIKVIDTGIGISDVQKQYLFSPFTQADQSTTRKYGGTGLGLSICKKLIALMEGNIEIISKLNQGSTFKFNLHLLTDKQGLKQAKNLQSEQQRIISITENNPILENTVLLVEDNAVNQKIALIMLKKLGFEIDLAADGKQAVEQWKLHHHKFIYMDCLMPEMDGYQATQEIRKLETEQSQKSIIIALTANATEEDFKKCIHAGMDDVVTKPFKKEDLINNINKWGDHLKSIDLKSRP